MSIRAGSKSSVALKTVSVELTESVGFLSSFSVICAEIETEFCASKLQPDINTSSANFVPLSQEFQVLSLSVVGFSGTMELSTAMLEFLGRWMVLVSSVEDPGIVLSSGTWLPSL